jgi:hypothetical protein
MRRLVLLAAIIALLTLSQSAIGAPPTQERVIVDDAETIPAGELCEFPVDFRATGRVLVTTHFNRDGSIDFISERPNIRITVTNPANGRFVTDSDIGLDKRVFNPDGTSDVLSTGIHFKTKSPDGGIIFRRIGLQIIHLDEDGEVISIDIVGGTSIRSRRSRSAAPWPETSLVPVSRIVLLRSAMPGRSSSSAHTNSSPLNPGDLSMRSQNMRTNAKRSVQFSRWASVTKSPVARPSASMASSAMTQVATTSSTGVPVRASRM